MDEGEGAGFFYVVRQEDDVRKCIVRQILFKSTDFLRWIIVPVRRQGGVTLSYVCLHCHRYPLGAYIWWVSAKHGKKQSKKKQCNWWCAACGGQNDWRNQNRVFGSYRTDSSEEKVSRVHAPPNGVCENLIQANQQMGGDSRVPVLVGGGLQERSRLHMMDELGRFTTVDTHEAVKVGDLAETRWCSPQSSLISVSLPRSRLLRRGGRVDASKRRRRWAAHFHRYRECGRH